MIYKVEGDILLSKAHAIVHGVGLKDPMNKGLALDLSNKYPLLQKDFNCWRHQHNTKPGEAWLWVGQENVRIVNLITHESAEPNEHNYEKATLINIKHALSELVKIIAHEKLTSIAVPRLGAGSGDLDWDDVWWLIENILGGLAIPVYVYVVYQPGQPADEPGVEKMLH
ncbi:MAG: macro domain-containing protein [Methylomonas sp.]|jgi:O-acetyl-ADP-ribose deacetylase (regulator of RNase III)